MDGLLFDAPKRLLHLLESLQAELGQSPRADATSDSAIAPLLASIDATASRYETVIWEVLMPHLIRRAPELASATVTTLQANHRVEKELRDVLKEAAANGSVTAHGSHARVRTSTDKLVEVLRSSLAIFDADVSRALEALPDDQRQALTAVVSHEQARSDGPGDTIAPSVSQAIDELEPDRNSLPIPIATRSVGGGTP